MENSNTNVGNLIPPVQLTVTLSQGTAILPSWIVVLFAALFVVASVGLVVVLWVETQMVKESRIEQLYIEDIENVLIRAHLADRSDFAPHNKK